jgi:Fic family protein
MLTLDPERLAVATLPIGTGWLLGTCMEARGKQDLWVKQKPEVLSALKEQAMIQSEESSNRIEGVTVSAKRLRPLVLGSAKPRDRSEEELAGYRRALDWILSSKGSVSITPGVIRRLHSLAQGGHSGDAGEWKRRDNEIVEILPNGERRIRFMPTAARETPNLIAALCKRYQEACHTERIPPLLIIATFVFDFLCVHPFRDGNGRVSRLVTTLLLKTHGFEVVRYISLERLVEERKEEYYGILRACSDGWHEGNNEIVPWWNYFLGVLRSGYREFERQVESTGLRPAKSEIVRRTVLEQLGRFTLADMIQQSPAASPQLIKKVLAELKHEGKIRLTGRGRGGLLGNWQLKQDVDRRQIPGFAVFPKRFGSLGRDREALGVSSPARAIAGQITRGLRTATEIRLPVGLPQWQLRYHQGASRRLRRLLGQSTCRRGGARSGLLGFLTRPRGAETAIRLRGSRKR